MRTIPATLTRTSPPASPRGGTLQAQAEELVESWRSRHRVPGLTVSIRSAGQPVLDVASGVANLRTKRPMKIDDRMWAGSITKTMTAATVLRLAEQGKLSLGDKLSTWIPDVPESDRITLRMLLKHTAGVPNITASTTFSQHLDERPLSPMTKAELIQQIASLPRERKPGARYDYSNSHYNLLGAVIEQATGRPYEAVVRDELFAPIQVDDTRIDTGAGRSPVAVHEYTNFGTGLGPTDHHSIYGPGSYLRSIIGAAGGMVTTAPSLARLGESLLWSNGDGQSAHNRELMLDQGLGIFLTTVALAGGERTMFAHSGALLGASAYLGYVPDTEQTIAIMANNDNEDVSELVGPLLDLLARHSAARPMPPSS